jgi:hypothetical protein
MYRILTRALIACFSASVALADEAPRGKQLALEHCRRCHVIPGERNMGVGNSPSFKSMVQSSSEDWRHKFEVFYALRPHPSFVIIQEFRSSPEFPLGITPVVLAMQDLEHLMAYVDELAGELRK